MRGDSSFLQNIGGTEDELGLRDGRRNWRLDGSALEDAVEEVEVERRRRRRGMGKFRRV